MNNLKIVIIEDEEVAADRLGDMLHNVSPGIEIVAKIESVKEAVQWLTDNSADLIFLDIQLSDGLSFNIFDYITVDIPVIFTTAYDEYAIKAFRINSIDYLLKPIREEELRQSLKKYRSLRAAFKTDMDNVKAMIKGEEPGYQERLLIQVGNNYRLIEVKEIAYFFVMDKGTYLRTFKGKTYTIDHSLDKLEQSITDPGTFFRINRKYIINIKSIDKMVAWSRSRIKLSLDPAADKEDDTVVSIERSSDFKKWLNK